MAGQLYFFTHRRPGGSLPHAPSPARIARNTTLLGWHVLALIGSILYLPGWRELLLAAAVYTVGMFAVTAGYHRYFAHRSFRTSRIGQFVLAWLAQSTLQKGVLWWASHHRAHHRFSDHPGDPHSPVQVGFWTSHLGWVLSDDALGRDDDRIKDLLRFAELRWLDRYYYVPALVLGVGMAMAGGLNFLVWGFALPMLAVQHVTLLINSLAHVRGDRPYETKDRSRNHALLAVLTMGEGWHNNHHRYQAAARQGFEWWEIDLTWYLLCLLQRVGVVSQLHEPPERVLATRRSREVQVAQRAYDHAVQGHRGAHAAACTAAERMNAAQEQLAAVIAREAAQLALAQGVPDAT